MFDFEKLNVYQEARLLNKEIISFLSGLEYCDPFIKDQLKRASLSIVLNIAEGSGKLTKPSKRNYYVIARGSVYECVSIIDIMQSIDTISNNKYRYFYQKYETISKMLLGLIKSQS